MRIGCSTTTFRNISLDEALERIKSAGYKIIETQAFPGYCPHIDLIKDSPIEFKDKIASYGLDVCALDTQPNLVIDKEAASRLKHALKWAKEAEVPIVSCSLGEFQQEISEEEGLTILKEKLVEITREAEELKVFLCIETHEPFSIQPEGLQKIFSMVNSKWLGITYDAGNVYRFGGEPVNALKAVVGWVRHIHLKGFLEGVPLSNAKERNQIDIERCLSVLKENDYSGVVAVEIDDILPDAEELIKDGLTYLKRIERG